jgi:hypothetical protein
LADDDGLGVAEDGGDGEAAGALHIHEEGPGSGHKGLNYQVSISKLREKCFEHEELRTFSLCLRASEAGLGLRRSTARTYVSNCQQLVQLRGTQHSVSSHPIQFKIAHQSNLFVVDVRYSFSSLSHGQVL